MSEESMEDFSLADLANIDVSGVAEVRFETLPMGVYTFEITNSDMQEGTNSEGDKRFSAEVEMKIVECKSIIDPEWTRNNPDGNKDSLIGKTYTEKMFLTPGAEQQKVFDAIGRIKAFVIDVGGEWGSSIVANVQNLKGVTFTGKITHQVDKEDKSRKYARLRLDPKKA